LTGRAARRAQRRDHRWPAGRHGRKGRGRRRGRRGSRRGCPALSTGVGRRRAARCRGRWRGVGGGGRRGSRTGEQRDQQGNDRRRHQGRDHRDGADQPAVGPRGRRSGRVARLDGGHWYRLPYWLRGDLFLTRRGSGTRGDTCRLAGAADRALHGPQGALTRRPRGRLGRVLTCHRILQRVLFPERSVPFAA
jgi:hypothetical protein